MKCSDYKLDNHWTLIVIVVSFLKENLTNSSTFQSKWFMPKKKVSSNWTWNIFLLGLRWVFPSKITKSNHVFRDQINKTNTRNCTIDGNRVLNVRKIWTTIRWESETKTRNLLTSLRWYCHSPFNPVEIIRNSQKLSRAQKNHSILRKLRWWK